MQIGKGGPQNALWPKRDSNRIRAATSSRGSVEGILPTMSRRILRKRARAKAISRSKPAFSRRSPPTNYGALLLSSLRRIERLTITSKPRMNIRGKIDRALWRYSERENDKRLLKTTNYVLNVTALSSKLVLSNFLFLADCLFLQPQYRSTR